MNSFVKANLPWLSLLGMAVIIVALTYFFRPRLPEYQTGIPQILKLMNDSQLEVAVSAVSVKQLIDIRPAELYTTGHAENAINIPVRNLLDKESIKVFDELLESGKEVIIYGTDELQATAPWLLLQQLGYQNVKILKGRFTSDNNLKEPELASTETMLLDTAAFRVNPVVNAELIVKPATKKSKAVIPERKIPTSGGGC